MVDERKYQALLDDYLSRVERVVEEFESELEKQTQELQKYLPGEGARGVEEDRKRPAVQHGGRRTAQGPGIFNDD